MMLTLRRYWREGLLAIVLIFAGLQWSSARHWQKRYGNEAAAHAQTRADFKAFANGVREKSEAIVAKVDQRNRRVTAEYRAIEKENDSEIRRRIDAAVAAVRVRTGQSGANPGGGGDELPSASQASVGSAGAGAAAVVPASDLERCAAAVVKAEGWQAWYRAAEAVER